MLVFVQSLHIVEKTNLGRRKAYYLVEVSRTYDRLPVPRSRLRKIGWTKLQLIGKHIDASNLNGMLELAENNNSKELERILRGGEPWVARPVACQCISARSSTTSWKRL
jgi:hypothetical protein